MKLEIEIPDEVVKDLLDYMENSGKDMDYNRLQAALRAHDAIIAELKHHEYQNRKPNRG
jgi:hypothetical protein